MIDARRTRLLVSFAVLVLLLLSGGMLHGDQDFVAAPLAEMLVGEPAPADPGNSIADHPAPAVASVLVRHPVSRGPPA